MGRLHAFLLLVLLGTIWGTGYSLARIAMTNGVPPLGYSFWQSLGPAIVVILITCFRKNAFHFDLQHARYYLICGLTGIAIPNTAMYFAAPHLPASILAIIVNTVPIIAYPMALLAGLEKVNGQRMLGIAMAVIGLMLIVIPKTSLPSPEMIPWALATLITPLSFAFCSIYIARYRPADSDSLSLTVGMLVFSSLILMPLVIQANSFYWFNFPFTLPDWVIVLEILLSSVGYVLLFQLIKVAGPVYYSLVDTVVVLTGVAWGYFLFDERLNLWTASAVCFIVLALALVTQQQPAKPKKVT